MRTNALYGLDAHGKLFCCDEEWVASEDGVTVIRKAAAGNNGSLYTIYEIVLAPHYRTPIPLIPEGTLTIIYITEGTLAVRLNEQTITVNAGSLVQAPEQATWVAWNPTSSRVRCLAIAAGALSQERCVPVLPIG
ncbi:MAG: hypothetical protein BroJett021_14890 [Chloroflexota bacterium]|nr:hypothetical protein [Caldilinea sp.]GIK72501.1 MAG: hypothetical protein BroJett021_14890 [Chloroflexota bacterium]